MKKFFNFQLSLAFLISGAAGILYEILWVRLLSLAFGGVTLTVGLVTSLFLAGLAIGAILGGKLADRIWQKDFKKVFFFYGLVEILIALLGILNWQIFGSLAKTPGFWRFPLAYLLVFLQAGMAGLTWPLMFKLFLGFGGFWSLAGRITFLNTFGGALGAFLASFFLLASLGIKGVVMVAVFQNLLAAFLVILAIKKTAPASLVRQEIVPGKTWEPKRDFILLICLALGVLGFLGMGLEIFWMRSFGLVLGSSVYSFSLVLTVILLGLALGGLIVDFFGERFSQKGFTFLFGLLALSIFWGQGIVSQTPYFVVSWSENFGRTFLGMQIVGLGVVFLTVFFPSLISGVLFPKGVMLLKDIFGKAGEKSGLAYFSNTLGAVLGGFLTSVFLLSFLGLKLGMAVFGAGAGLLFLVLSLVLLRLSLVVLLFLTVLIGAGFLAFQSFNKQALSAGAWLYGSSVLEKNSGIKLLSYQDGRESTVTTTWQEGTTALLINGKADASSDVDMGTQAILGHVPVLLHQNPQNVLVIGLGSGITAGAISQHQKVEKITVVEIEPAVVEAAKTYFAEQNYEVLENPKTRLVIGDGRNFLLGTKEKFEVITSEPSNPWMAGTANLFTQDFFEIGKTHLSDEGVFFQWLHLYNLKSSEVKSIVKTFASVFPYVQVWTSTNPVDIFLAGKTKPFSLSWERFEESVARPAVKESLARRGFADEIRLFSLLWSGNRKTREWVKEGDLHTDSRPILEFKAPFGLFEDTLPGNFESLLSFFQDDPDLLPIEGMPEDKKEAFVKAREARRFLVESRKKLAEGKLDEALHLAGEGFVQDSEAPSVKRFLAELYLKKGESLPKDQRPEAYFQKAIDLNPNLYQSYLKLIQIYLAGNQAIEAEKLLEEAVKRFFWSGTVVMYKGILAGMKEDGERAEELLLQASQMEPWNPLIHNNLAYLYEQKGEYGLAIKAWENSLALNSDQPQIKSYLKNRRLFKNIKKLE